MTPIRALLLDLRAEHRRLVRNALLPMGWIVEDCPADRTGLPPTPEGGMEVLVIESHRPGTPATRSAGPTLWILSPGDGIPSMIGEGPHEFLPLPTSPEEIAARARMLVRVAGLERAVQRHEMETARQIARLRGLASSMEIHLAPSVGELMSRLTAIGGAEGAASTEVRSGEIVRIREAAAHLVRRIEETLDAARAEVGLSIETSLRRVDLRPVLQELQEWAVPRIRGKEQELLIHLAPDSPPVCGDPERLGQALRHLVENAHLYSPHGSRIEVGAEPDPDVAGLVRLSVIDDAPITRPRGTVEIDGTADDASFTHGVGLTLVDAIASVSGGRFEIANAGERGTRSQIQIPIWGSRAAQIAEAQSILSSNRVDGEWWVCRSTGPVVVSGNRRCAASILLSPGEILKMVDDPIPGWDRIGRVRDLRERGSLLRTLQPSARIQTIEARRSRAA